MINVGIVGVGFMGWIHYLAYEQVSGIRVSAIVSRDAKKRAGDWTSIKGNFGPPGRQVDLSDVKVYETLEQMLADPDVDVVDLCLPPQMHLPAIEKCFAASKHVFCEKPLALSTSDCDRAIAASKKSGLHLMVGHVLPWFAEFRFAVDAIESGKYGRLTGGVFKRIVSDPLWLQDYWDRQKVGGPLFDLHVHDAHLIRVLFGMPNHCFSSGRLRGGVTEFAHTIFQFADSDVTVSATTGSIDQQSRPFCHAYEIYLERATLQFELAAYSDGVEKIEAKLMESGGSGEDALIQRLVIENDDPVQAFASEVEEVRDSILSGQPSRVLDGILARDAVAICEAQEASIKSRELVAVG